LFASAGALAACSLLVNTSDLASGPAPLADASSDGGFAEGAAEGAADSAAEATADAAVDGSALSARYAAAVQADNPIAYLRLEEASGPSAKNETGGPAAVYSAGIAFGVPGAFAGSRAIAMNGSSNGAVTLGNVAGFDVSKPFSLELWYRPDGIDNAFRFLANEFESVDGGLDSFGVYTQSSVGIVAERYVRNVSILGSATAPQPAVFHHLVGTYDGASVTLFVDSVGVAQKADARASASRNPVISFGAYNVDGPTVIGAIDELAVYNTALTSSQVAAHYAASGR
jgi:hypothetical protein